MEMILTLVSAALLATAAGAEPMVGIEDDAQSKVRIVHDDLNLGSKRGCDRLNSRVIAAVRTMCQDDNRDPLRIELAEQLCFARSNRDASDQVDRAVKAHAAGFAGGSSSAAIIGR